MEMSNSLRFGGTAAALATLVLLACDSVTPITDRWIGHIGDLSEQDPVPETATAGVPVEITFTTTFPFCAFDGGTEVDIRDNITVVTPFDTQSGGACTRARPIRHRATVVFEDPGTARVGILYSTEAPRGPFHPRLELKVYAVEVSR